MKKFTKTGKEKFLKNIVRLKNKKADFCRNLAIRNSKSGYIAFIDSDDIWEREKPSRQLDFMDKKNNNIIERVSLLFLIFLKIFF